VQFIVVTQNIDTDESNPMAQFLLHIMAASPELERELIRERVTADPIYVPCPTVGMARGVV
jgi:DNA invertase Pin-like site-specific DNA recombinase